ncbi:hypothetical protein G7047_23125 [Diaphorobacter sp. HDW4A]|uniref:zinc-ribbon domain containing protein n=1 Tax=Diaphorobacter sp. HDW4A TaxID=2714924 RepID=UPI00140831B5|nr:zinc-ribbon domain containing protein [Diaphorobacter sp. HDW4A]QIL82503.1 hypothetical protein G7047_23125 [Diaphorobacter sp. HDW4A]
MKSNKQRREEIMQLRLKRAARALEPHPRGEVVSPTMPHRRYVDKAFTCIDCGVQQVWTAKQQLWWYEIAKGNPYTAAVRCRPCRKLHAEQLKAMQSHPGANKLGEEVAWLKSLKSEPSDPAKINRLNAALDGRHDSVRKVAVDAIAQWQRPQDEPRLRALVDRPFRGYSNPLHEAAARALLPLLRHPHDEAWVLEQFAMNHNAARPFMEFARAMPDAALHRALMLEAENSDQRRLHNLCMMMEHIARPLPANVVYKLENSNERHLRAYSKRYKAEED